MRTFLLLLFMVLGGLHSSWGQRSDIEIYGTLPTIDDPVISPSGSKIAYFQNDGNGGDFLVVRDLATMEGQGLELSGVKGQYITFAGDNHVVLSASDTTRVRGFRGKFEMSAAYAFNLERGKGKFLLSKMKTLFPAQTGMGRIVGRSSDGDSVFTPAYVGERSTDPRYSLIKADLDTGRGNVISRGRTTTIDWFV
ncbi:MAG: hypothetical protein AAFQ67_08375, partial [Pseudomonadota bacterium]